MADQVADQVAADGLRVKEAATVICLRRARGPPGPPLKREEIYENLGGEETARMQLLFGSRDVATMDSGWEVLMGQAECQNWLKSTPEFAAVMRYAGEWKFGGGTIDPGESPREAARRELEEEFLVKLPPDGEGCELMLLNVIQVKPVRNVSFIVHNFIAVAEENPWLEEHDIDAVNAALAKRREDHKAAMEDSSFWEMDKHEKERISPEVRTVAWLDMHTAVRDAFTGMSQTFVPVNEFQAEEFARLKKERRDQMFATLAVLLEAECFPSPEALHRHTEEVDAEQELLNAQWLFEGWPPERVEEAWSQRQAAASAGGIFHLASERRELRQSHTLADAMRNA